MVLALSSPAISHALGLGTIRIESSLNEPLSAQIEVIGAAPEELQAIRASVASPELFERFEVERPAFLSSTTIAAGTNAAGRPVLEVRSTAPFTEPMVDLLIDLRAGSQHMVRDYPLLLDPPAITPETSAGVVMPSADESGLLEQLPPVQFPDIALTSIADGLAPLAHPARASTPASTGTNARHRVAQRVVVQRAVAHAPATREVDQAALRSAVNKLNGQVQFLQQTLGETTRQLAGANARIGDMERSGTQQPVLAARAAGERSKSSSTTLRLASVLGILAIVAGALVYAWQHMLPARTSAPRLTRTAEPTFKVPVLQPAAGIAESATVEPVVDHDGAVVPEPADCGITVEMAQIEEIDVSTVEQPGPAQVDEPDTVVIEELGPKVVDATGTTLDYNLADLDGRAHHVEMPGTLRDHVVLVERRKNMVDTLMAAIKRDPTRSDLRMKLMETLYATAANNLRIFKEVVRDLERHPERLQPDEWAQVMAMGREIAPDDTLFADQSADSNVA